MKRLISLGLIVALLLSFAVPVMAEETDPAIGCSKEPGCTLTEGHEGDCVLPQPESCAVEQGCILNAGHQGPCQKAQEPMTADVLPDSDPEPNSNLPGEAGLYFATGETYTKELSVTVGTAADAVLMYFDGTALEAAADYVVSEGLSVTPKAEGGIRITAAAEGSHTITRGDYTVTVTAAAAQQDGVEKNPAPQANLPAEAGLYFVSGESYTKELTITAGSPTGAVLMYYNGNALTAAANYTAENGLNITSRENVAGGIQISAKGDGSYTITCQGSSVTVIVRAPDFLCYRLDMNGEPGYYNGNRMKVGFSMTAGFYCDGAKIVMEQPGWIVYRVTSNEDGTETVTEDSTGLSMTLAQDGRWKLQANKSGKWQLGLPNENSRITITVEAADLNLNQSLEPGLYVGISENKYFYISQTGLFHPGTFIGPIVLSDYEGNKRALTDQDISNMTLPAGLSLTHLGDGFWKAETKEVGDHAVIYTDAAGQKYALVFTVEERRPLFVQMKEGGPWLSELVVTEDEPTEVAFAFQGADGTMIPAGTVNGSNDEITVTRNMNTGKFTVTVRGWGGRYNANYFFDDYLAYTIPVKSEEAKRLALVNLNSDSKVPVFDYMAEVNQTIQADFRFGLPSKKDNTGLQPVTDATKLTVSSGLKLTKNENASGYTLEILEEGNHTVTYRDTDGKDYVVAITAVPAAAGGMLFALQGSSSAPQFTSVMSYGQIFDLRICYGSYGNYTELKADQLTMVGDSVIKSQNGPFVCLEYNKPGQTLLQYKDGDNIIHNYVVKCYGDHMEMLQTEYSEQGHRFTVNIPYGGQTVTVGYAWCNSDEMVMTGGNTFNEPEDSEWPVTEEYVVGAMYAGPGHSVLEPAPAEFYNLITNMSLTFQSINNTVPNPEGKPNGTLSAAQKKTWDGRTIWASKFQGTPGLYFDSSMLMTFDIQLDGGTHRFYRTGNLNYRPLPSQAVEVDIKNLKVLNTLLSNSYVLINYLEDKVDGFKYDGGDLTLTLPAGNYNGVLVSQIVLPGSTDAMGTFRIQGSSEKGGTTVGGIYSKGYLYGVSNLNFHAMGNNSRITFDGETFTCGLFVNNTQTAYQPEFDFDTLWKYHPEYRSLSRADAEELFKTYNPSVPTGSNSYNMGSITNCTFKGYDYAMRTDKGGFVQGSSGCTIEQCKYGVYINAGGMDTLHTDGRANTIWRNNRFIKNWVPVCITGLPNDLSPYYIRFIDNVFQHNRGDFWIQYGDQYYFQRNHYSGKWNDSYQLESWSLNDRDYWEAQWSHSDTETARAAAIVPGSPVVVTNPCRSQPNSTDNLLIFDTDDQQHTMIFQSDADSMLVNPDSIGNLSGDLEVPVLDNKGQPIGHWTIEGGK